VADESATAQLARVPSTDPRIDAYIAKAQPFAQPILAHLRAIVHTACPEVEETIKWGHPFFDYHGLVCHMAAFKAHVALGFWRGAQVVPESDRGAMGNFGRITAVADLPAKRTLVTLVKQAVALNLAGAQTPVGARMARQRAAAKTTRGTSAAPRAATPKLPADFAGALAAVRGARTHFDGMRPSHRREYIEWVTGAKQAATRARRIAKAVAMIAEGKSQNWKYER
jgi:hypothetical protein